MKKYLRISEIAMAWNLHPASIGRIMRRFGCDGLKTGTAKQAAHLYAAEEVRHVELLLKSNATKQEEV